MDHLNNEIHEIGIERLFMKAREYFCNCLKVAQTKPIYLSSQIWIFCNFFSVILLQEDRKVYYSNPSLNGFRTQNCVINVENSCKKYLFWTRGPKALTVSHVWHVRVLCLHFKLRFKVLRKESYLVFDLWKVKLIKCSFHFNMKGN